MKELAIGEIGEIDGVKVKCVEGPECHLCAFCGRNCSSVMCTPGTRLDQNAVYFEAVTE